MIFARRRRWRIPEHIEPFVCWKNKLGGSWCLSNVSSLTGTSFGVESVANNYTPAENDDDDNL